MNAILTTIGILLLASFAQVSSAAHGNERPIKDLSEANSQIHWPKGFDPKEADAFVHNEIWINAPANVIWGNLVIAGAEVEDRVELGARLNGNAKAAKVHGAVDRELFEPELLCRDFGDPARVVVSLLFETLFGEGARRKAHSFGFLATDLAAGQEGEIFGPMRPDHPVPESANVTGAGGNRWEADAGVFGDENHVAADTKLSRARQAVAMDHRYDGLGQVAQP